MKKSDRRSWFSKQPRWAQAAYQKARQVYSPRTAREKVRELIAAPARDFKVAEQGAKAFLKGDRSKHPLAISERQLRIKRAGLNPEAQAAGAARPKETYKSETTRIAAGLQRRTKAKAALSQHTVADEQRAKATRLDIVSTWEGRTYRFTEANRAMYEDNRRRWLNGEELSWQEWGNLRDFAAATSDPIQRVLHTSPKTRVEKLQTFVASVGKDAA